MERLIADARELGCEAVVLESASFMHAAHALYRSVGFVPADSYAGREFEDFEHEGGRVHAPRSDLNRLRPVRVAFSR